MTGLEKILAQASPEMVAVNMITLLEQTLPILINLRDGMVNDGRRSTDTDHTIFAINLAIFNIQIILGNTPK